MQVMGIHGIVIGYLPVVIANVVSPGLSIMLACLAVRYRWDSVMFETLSSI